jgi:FAD/FMN-containing dehydrogenase
MRVVLPGEAEYDGLRRPEVPRFDEVRPAAILRCGGVSDVVAALSYARDAGLPVAVRAGGHCFAGRSSTQGALLDVRPIVGVRVIGGRARIGAATRLGEVYRELGAFGLTVPAGCGPTVAIAGLTLGGGLGILGRRYGLTCDSLRTATVVLASGEVVTCSADRDTDLFWALRGGGAPGVVTELVFDTVPAPESWGFLMRFPADGAAAVLEGWQRYAPDAPPELAASAVLSTSSDPAVPVAVTVFGAVLGGDGLLDDLEAALVVRPVEQSRQRGSLMRVKEWLSRAEPHLGPWPDLPYLRSEFFRSAVPAADLVSLLAADRRPGEARELDFSPWSGAYNRVAADATAFPHRDARFLLKQSATAPDGWLERSYALTHPHGTGGAYPNFPEAQLPDRAYHLGNVDRLRGIREHYDPEGIFR